MAFYIQNNNGWLSCVEVIGGNKPDHPNQFGPYDKGFNPGEYRVKAAIAERAEKGDKTVFSLPIEDAFELRPLDPIRLFDKKWKVKDIMAALSDPNGHEELRADALAVKKYIEAAEAEEAAKKKG